MCAAPDYISGDDKSPPRAGITAPCRRFNSDTLSGKVARFLLVRSSSAEIRFYRWASLKSLSGLISSGGGGASFTCSTAVGSGRSGEEHLYCHANKRRLKENRARRAFKQVTFGGEYLHLLLLLLLRHLRAAVKVSAFAADLTVVVPQLLHVLQRGYANLLIRQLLTLKVVVVGVEVVGVLGELGRIQVKETEGATQGESASINNQVTPRAFQRLELPQRGAIVSGIASANL